MMNIELVITNNVIELHTTGLPYTPPTGGGGTWGSITGTLADQTDLQAALDAKQASLNAPNDNTKILDGTLAWVAMPSGGGGVTITDVTNEILKYGNVDTTLVNNPTRGSSTSTAFGRSAQATGTSSTAVGCGVYAGTSSTAVGCGVYAGTSSTAVGYNAQATGTSSTAVGYNAQATGAYSAAFGRNAQATGSQSTAVGHSALITNTSHTNSTVLGANTAVTGANQVQLGDSATTTYAYGAVQDRSDNRDKTNIQTCSLGLDFINALQARQWQWDYREDYLQPYPKREDYADDEAYQTAQDAYEDYKQAFYANPTKDGSKSRSRYHNGLIAQEVKATLDSLGIDWAGYQDHAVKGGLDVKSIGYAELFAPMLKAIQELSARVQALENTQ